MEQFLREVPFFSRLPDEDLRQVAEMVEVVQLAAGEILFDEGDPGSLAYVIREGQIEIIKSTGAREVLLNLHGPGAVIGEMALVERAPRTAAARAREDSVLLAIHQEQFDRLMNTSAATARAILGIMLERWRSTEAMLRQNEKMIQLGTLVAGIAHELNNPAAAVKRGAAQVVSAIDTFITAQASLSRMVLGKYAQSALDDLASQIRSQPAAPPLDSLTRSDREEAVESWLRDRAVSDPWQYSPILVDLNYDASNLEALATHFAESQLPTVITWMGALWSITSPLAEISLSAAQISEIVNALKTYSFLDQAPVQRVNVNQGLDNTLVVLRNALKAGITVRQEYATNLPDIEAYGSELSQVWTNIIDNAIDALDGNGQITIRTRQEEDQVVVEIIDNGPGIPDDVKGRLFEPFFTTKPMGQGTGLGLHICYNIVVMHHGGDIKVTSQPGETCFQIWLPVVAAS